MLKNISTEKEVLFPLVASAIDVEEDGHLWMLVNSKMKNCDQRAKLLKERTAEKLPSAGHLLARISENIRGRIYRRILFFR